MSEMASAGGAAAIGQERFVGQRACVVQGIAKQRDRFLARFVRRLALSMKRRDLGAQARSMEIGSMRQVDPRAPGLDRRRCLEHGVHWFRWGGNGRMPRCFSEAFEAFYDLGSVSVNYKAEPVFNFASIANPKR